MPLWLLDNDTMKEMDAASKSGVNISAEQQIEHEARVLAASGDSSRILSVRNGVASIEVTGVLTQRPSLFASLFGGGNTTYSEIVSAAAEARQDDSVSSVDLVIDSPGGQFVGLFDALAALQSIGKPITASVGNLAASAAYAIASQADTITVSSRVSRVGSVGVVATFYVYDDEVEVTSTEAPKKRPDVTTEEGRAMVREELDAMHDIFVESIATGRGVSIDTINADFGRGATLLADAALERGMIDSIAGPRLAVDNTETASRASGEKTGAKIVDLETLKAQHPEVYKAAVQCGIDQERDRVTAHLTMGKASGAVDTAHAAIEDGSNMTATLQAKYLTAGMNRQDVDTRQADDADAEVDSSKDAQKDDAKASADLLAATALACNIELEG